MRIINEHFDSIVFFGICIYCLFIREAWGASGFFIASVATVTKRIDTKFWKKECDITWKERNKWLEKYFELLRSKKDKNTTV